MRLVLERDTRDHVRFSPIQSQLGQELCAEHGAPGDVSTAVLIDEAGAHIRSTAVLRLFRWMGFPFGVLGRGALLLPTALRDALYSVFAKNRGAVWAAVRRCTGWGETRLETYRDRILGLGDGPLPKSWGFSDGEDEPVSEPRAL